MAGVEAERLHALAQDAGIFPQARHQLVRLGQDVDGLDAGSYVRHRHGAREEEGAPALAQPVDDRFLAGDKPADDAKGFAQRTHLDVDAAVQTEVVDDAAPTAPEHALAMRVVHHEHGAVRLGDLAQLVQRGDVTIHAEDPVAHDEPAAKLAVRGQLAAQVVHVVVRVADGARLAQPARVDDAGVVEFVGEDEVAVAHECGDRCQVGREAALEGDARLGMLELGQFLFQLQVQRHGAGDGADGARANAERVDGALGRVTQARVVGQAEIVVGAEVEEALAADGHARIHGRVDRADPGAQAGRVKLGQFVFDPG